MAALTRWDPFRELQGMRDTIDRLFAEMKPFGEGAMAFESAPALDIYETENAIKVDVPLPGVKPEEVEVTLTGNTLTIKGERKSKEEVKEENYYRREVRYGSFRRAVTLPETADTAKAEATFEDGMLHITFPRAAETQPQRLEVKTVNGKHE